MIAKRNGNYLRWKLVSTGAWKMEWWEFKMGQLDCGSCESRFLILISINFNCLVWPITVQSSISKVNLIVIRNSRKLRNQTTIDIEQFLEANLEILALDLRSRAIIFPDNSIIHCKGNHFSFSNCRRKFPLSDA